MNIRPIVSHDKQRIGGWNPDPFTVVDHVNFGLRGFSHQHSLGQRRNDGVLLHAFVELLLFKFELTSNHLYLPCDARLLSRRRVLQHLLQTPSLNL